MASVIARCTSEDVGPSEGWTYETNSASTNRSSIAPTILVPSHGVPLRCDPANGRAGAGRVPVKLQPGCPGTPIRPVESPSGPMATLVTPRSNERHWSVDVHLRRESDARYVAEDQCDSRGTPAPRLPVRKSRSAPLSACVT